MGNFHSAVVAPTDTLFLYLSVAFYGLCDDVKCFILSPSYVLEVIQEIATALTTRTY